MKPELKEFIKSHLDLIDDGKYEKLYYEHMYQFFARAELGLSAPRYLTEFLLSCRINPLNDMKRIPAYYLSGSDVESIVIPEGIEQIGSHAFSGCSKAIGTITLPASCTYVDHYAFDGCKEVTAVEILNKDIRFGDKVFYLCLTLLDMYYPGTVYEFQEHMPKNTNQIYTVHCTDGDYIVAGKDEIYSA